jgi:hypothetical protein
MKIPYLILLCLLPIFSAFADNFQLIFREGSSRNFAAYSYFVVFDSNRKQVSQGYSDKYGRIIVKVKSGNYTCQITYRNVTYKRSIVINGAPGMREILLP